MKDLHRELLLNTFFMYLPFPPIKQALQTYLFSEVYREIDIIPISVISLNITGVCTKYLACSKYLGPLSFIWASSQVLPSIAIQGLQKAHGSGTFC